MKKIAVVAPFTLLAHEEGSNRFEFIAHFFAQKFDVTFITSNFHHTKKSFRAAADIQNEIPYKVVLLEEPGYRANIGLKRIYSHFVFERHLKSYLKNTSEKFDGIYCAFPTMGAATICAKYAAKHRLKFVLDVQDIWPESILVYFRKANKMANWALYPLIKKAASVYKKADALVAVSDSYLLKATTSNTKALQKMRIYIGTDLSVYDKAVRNCFVPTEKNEDNFTGIYIGSLSHSYDIKTIIEASVFAQKSIHNFRINILGTGPFENEFKQFAQKLGAPVSFLGYKKYEEMCVALSQADFALHAISGTSQSTFTNKFCDYAAAGLPILNSSPSLEIISCINANNLGFNYEAGNPASLATAMKKLAKSDSLIKIGKNTRLFAEENLDRNKTYAPLLNLF